MGAAVMDDPLFKLWIIWKFGGRPAPQTHGVPRPPKAPPLESRPPTWKDSAGIKLHPAAVAYTLLLAGAVLMVKFGVHTLRAHLLASAA
jgi:hypothetical protein